MATALNVRAYKKNQELTHLDEISEKTIFTNLNFYSIVDNIKKLQLDSSQLIITDSKVLDFKSPVGLMFLKTNVFSYSAIKGEFSNLTNILKLDGNVKLSDNKGSSHLSSYLELDTKNKFFKAVGKTLSNVLSGTSQESFIVKADSLESWLDKKLYKFRGNIDTKLIRKRGYEGQIVMSSQFMELNQLKSHIFLDGGVSLKRNKYYLQATKADIFLENFNKSLKYYVLYDDIKLEEKIVLDDGTSLNRKAYSEKLEGFMKEGKVVMSGAPRVEQGDDVIKGYQITLRENVELVEVDDSQTSFEIKKDE
jgi:lipopolysaccharide export system protein LptA